MKKGLLLAAAGVCLFSSVVLANGPKKLPAKGMFRAPLTEQATKIDTTYPGTWNVMKISNRDTSAMGRHERYTSGLLTFLKGRNTGEKITEVAMWGTVIGAAPGSQGKTLIESEETGIFNCRTFCLSMLDALIKNGMKDISFVIIVGNHAVLEVGGWMVEVDGKTGERERYPKNEFELRHHGAKVYLRTNDPKELEFITYMEFGDRAKDLDTALWHYQEAVKASHGGIPGPIHSVYTTALLCGYTALADEAACQYKALTGRTPDEVQIEIMH